jgi:chromosome partitioning protein
MSEQVNYLSAIDLANCLGGLSVQAVYKAIKSYDIKTTTKTNKRIVIPSNGVRKLLVERGFKYPKLNISFQIVKGGVGKTSLSFCLALRASHYGARVLVIDLDQQGNLTRSLNIEARNRPVWMNIIRDEATVKDAIVSVSENLDVIPSNLNNSRLDVELIQSSRNLKDIIHDLIAPVRNNYDLVVMDCPPAINKINAAVTCSSDMIIIPINPDPYAMDGLDFTLSELKKLKKEFKLNFEYLIVWNKYDGRERLGAYYMHELAKREDLVEKIMPVVCRTDTAIKNAIFSETSIFGLSKKSPMREDIDQFTKEVLGINQWNMK